MLYTIVIFSSIQLKEAIKETLKIFAENISLNYVSLKVILLTNKFTVSSISYKR